MTRIYTTTPCQDGFRMPGEFERHTRCWMLWPERNDNWRLDATPAQKAFASVAQAISEFEPVSIGVSKKQFDKAMRLLPSNITIVEMESDDAWMRDVGPTFVKDNKGNVRGIDWGFNAWGGLDGGLYFPWDKDEKVASAVMENQKIDGYKAPFILEGGAIHTDGEGTLITTEQCLLNPNRNPDLSKDQIETLLKDYLCVDTIIWLDQGVYMDETDGHVDNICCFIKPGEVLLHWTDDRSDPQYDISHDALERLSWAKDAMGRTLLIHKIHQPGPLTISCQESKGVKKSTQAAPREKGSRLAGSYVNFYIANNGIVMPVFNDPQDAEAVAKIQSLFPKRKVIRMPAREILLGGGNIHCITQQQP
ncbi:MAG: agmatine deiminase [Proteobacteria bacterium]|nr:agmatine deiminase [Pseudomonadota bacterium]MBU1582267.1 agmatine deiminase [Pseudomonadota bacterium]MBU2453269.1 agmatine deiminase [Pseudomonadota bacterium]MBU2632039.1 agmatine deiminase [Pseudomonadota bacterium]